ncbi:MAG: membrane protein insertion efficiency factor YidD [candidate division Zixibacteria bacterium]|nr:membrane protein insertion efficiency factor YidD [candidate division Zixibacteria bacterium]
MKKIQQAIKAVAQAVIVGAIRAYQFTLGPLLPMACRFEPSCSRYALEAVRKYGPWRGSALAVLRIVRCNPLHPGGYDPVP